MPGTSVVARRFELVLPAPPSANQMYRYLVVNKLVRPVPSKHYKAWKKACKAVLNRANEGLFKGSEQLVWHLEMYANINHLRDLDNAAKAVIDMVAKHYAIADQWLDKIYLERSPLDWEGDRVLAGSCAVRFTVFDTGKRKVVRHGEAGDELHAE